MSSVPRWLKLIGLASIVAEVAAATAVLWHGGSRSR